MTPFKKNITKSIDNLNSSENNVANLNIDFEKVFSQDTEDNIESIIENNIDTKSGSSLTLNNTVENGKIEYSILGDTVQDGTPTPENPVPVQVVTGDNQLVVQNKNLFVSNLPATSTTFRDITVTRNNDEYTVSGTASGNATIALTNVFSKLLANETYTMSVQIIEGTMGGNIVTTVYNEDGTTSYNYFNLNESRLSQSVSSNSNKTIRAIEIYIPTGTEVNYKFKIQLEKSSTATTYIAHQEQFITLHLGSLELCKICDYQDVITGTKDNWKVVRNIGKVVYTGASSENWAFQYGYAYYILIVNCPDNTDLIQCICNYYKGVSRTKQSGQVEFECSANNNTFRINDTRFEGDVTNFKTWLSTHNLILYYVLDTPIEETITDTTLINDLNNLYDVNMYENQTNIVATADTGNVPMVLDVTTFVTSKGV